MGLPHPDLIPFELFTVTDDRSARYDLDFTPGSGPEWTCEISLRPTPPDDIRWLDVAAPLGPAVRVELTGGNGPATDELTVSEAKLSPGEHLLIMLAEHLLTVAPEFSRNLRRQLAAVSPGPLQAMTAALGDIIAGLEAADVLSPLSLVPARLAALCASLRIGGHGIAAAPADDLPEPWLSLLAHYQRRKPDTGAGARRLRGGGGRPARTGRRPAGPARPAQLRGKLVPARAGPWDDGGRSTRSARRRPGLPAVDLAQGQRRPVARCPPGRLAPDRTGEP